MPTYYNLFLGAREAKIAVMSCGFGLTSTMLLTPGGYFCIPCLSKIRILIF